MFRRFFRIVLFDENKKTFEPRLNLCFPELLCFRAVNVIANAIVNVIVVVRNVF